MPLWPPPGSTELEMQKPGQCPCQRHFRGHLPLLAAVTCYLQSPAKADTKLVTELLQCSGDSRLLEQPPLGPKPSEFKPITSTGKARGLNPASPLLGPSLPFTDVLYFMCNLLTKTSCFLKFSAIYCFAKSVSHYTSDQCSSTWELHNWGEVLKSRGLKTKNLLTWLQALWPKYSAGCTNPTGNSRLWCSSQGRVTRETNCAQFLKLTQKQFTAGRNSWTATGCFGLAGFVQDGCYIFQQLSIRFDGVFTEDKLSLLTTT